ncbi:MAG: alpha/beta hydrolase [Gudongella sp.]|nr:alpha/beta hydrolase [Gudongella sp.]
MDYFKLRDDYELFLKEDLIEKPKAIVIISHGFAEHLSRYDYFTESLNQVGYGVIRYDLRGHGRNTKDLGHIKSFDDFILDLDEIYKETNKRFQEVPIFLFGHSMGGLITAIYGTKSDLKVNGIILSGPAVGKLPSAKKINKNLIKIVCKIYDKIMIKNPIDKNLCKNEDVYFEYLKDKYVLHRASLRLYYEFLFIGTDRILKDKGVFISPILIVHGSEDKIVPISISKSFFNSISSIDKTFKEYNNLYHEILNEKERDYVIKDIISWLDNRI